MHLSPSNQAHCISVVDVTTHSNIPIHDFATKIETKEESKQMAGAADPRTVQPAKRSASSSLRVKASDEESPATATPTITTMQTARSGRAGGELQSNPDEAILSVDKSAKESKSRSPTGAETSTRMEDLNMGKETLKAMRDPVGPEGEDQAGNSVHSVQVESAALGGPSGICTSCLDLGPFPDTVSPTSSRDPAGYHAADEKEEAASAQAVKRGHQVQVEEIPDDEDNTSFQLSRKANQKSPVAHEETQSTVAESSNSGAKTEKVPHEWLKPFEAKWTLRGIKEARTESEAWAILKNWIHRTRVEEVVDEMLEGLRRATCTNALEQMDELRQPRRYICRLSGSDKALTTDISIEMPSSHARITSSALIDSGCTSSAINRAFVEKHNIPTRATAAPITVYNADGSKNSSGQITAFAELRITIGDHAERIDLAITDLKDRDVFLGHDWLVRHNPLINWQTGKMIFGRCQCRHTPIPLPDADPYDKWDEELEEGDSILAISFEEAIRVRTMRHVANDLAAKANAEKEAKTFEEMVPEWC